MLSDKRKFGHRIVVEIDLFPASFDMAAFAILAVATHVRIVFRVAAKTGARGMLVDVADAMTTRARRRRMAADQRKSGTSVLESSRSPR